MTFDLVIRNGRLVDAEQVRIADLAIADGRIAAVGPGLNGASEGIDAAGRFVFPGGVDSHVHMGQLSSLGDPTADDFWTGSRSAAFGGTTTVVPFAAQHRGRSISDVVADARARAAEQMTVDYGLHLIVTDWTGSAAAEFEEAAAAGIAAVKIYLTYDRLKLDGETARAVMAAARRAGCQVMVHAEDDDLVSGGRRERVAAGDLGAGSHLHSHSRDAEVRGVAQAIALAEEAGAALYLAHLSTPAAIDLAGPARAGGLDVTAETCPHYLLLDESRLADPIEQAAPFMSSPPVRGEEERIGLVARLQTGEIELVTSDHSPYTMDQKLPTGPDTPFTDVANGLPGVELRLPLLYTATVAAGKLDMSDFVRLVSTNPAKVCGLYPRKGSLNVGADADLVVWQDGPRTVRWVGLHDNVGYTPYEGMVIAGGPAVVISRGEVIVDQGGDRTRPGRGRFVLQAS